MTQSVTPDESRLQDRSCVIAAVSSFFINRGYGFATSNDGRRIFFHKHGCRRVTGTADRPRLTDEKALAGPIARGSRIVMRVVLGDKGPKANVWGHLPTSTTEKESPGNHE